MRGMVGSEGYKFFSVWSNPLKKTSKNSSTLVVHLLRTPTELLSNNDEGVCRDALERDGTHCGDSRSRDNVRIVASDESWYHFGM